MTRSQICLISDAPRIRLPWRLPSKRYSQNRYSNVPDEQKFSVTRRFAPRNSKISVLQKRQTCNSWRHKQHLDHYIITETFTRQSNFWSEIAIKSQM